MMETKTTTMLDAALEYAARGYAVFPCSPGTKIPFAGTAGSKEATTDEARIREWWARAPTANIGLATGTKSGLYVIDIDAESDPIMVKLPMTWTARTRGGGWHYVYRLPPGVVLKNTTKDSEAHPNPRSLGRTVDSRGEGGYILVWPSVVDGKPYSWANDIDPAELPAWVVERVTPKQETQAMTTRATFEMVSTSWAAKAVDEECAVVATTPKGSRHTALVRASFKIGQIVAGGHLSRGAAQAELENAIAGYSLSPGERRHALKTINQCLNNGMASPRHPQQRMRVDPFSGAEITLDEPEEFEDQPEAVEVVEVEVVKAKSTADNDARRWALLNGVRSLGGLCDSYTAWVVRGADHPQPGLTLASLLALGSVLAGRRLVYRRSLSSLYVVSLANSAEGKNRPQSCLGRVIDECWPVLAGANSFSSGPAFTDSVRKAVDAGVGTCLVLDEYGMQLAAMLGPRAATHRQDIKASLTELSTKGVDKWSPALSLVKGGGKMELWAPSVTLLGSTTPDSLHSVLTSTDVADGFVGRHVWFRAQDKLPMWQAPETRGDDTLPIDVRSAVMSIRQHHEDWHMGLAVTENGIDALRLYDPQTVTETPEAAALLLAHKLACDEDRREGLRLDIPRATLGRMPEFAARIALILAVLSQPEAVVPVVSELEVQAAIALAEDSAQTFADSLAKNRRADWHDPAAQVELVVSALRLHGGVATKAELLRSCRKLSAQQVMDALNRLVDEERGVLEKKATTGRSSTVFRLTE